MMIEPEKLYKVSTFADLTGYTKTYIFSRMRLSPNDSKYIDSIKIDGMYFIPAKELKKFNK